MLTNNNQELLQKQRTRSARRMEIRMCESPERRWRRMWDDDVSLGSHAGHVWAVAMAVTSCCVNNHWYRRLLRRTVKTTHHSPTGNKFCLACKLFNISRRSVLLVSWCGKARPAIPIIVYYQQPQAIRSTTNQHHVTAVERGRHSGAFISHSSRREVCMGKWTGIIVSINQRKLRQIIWS